ncbi:MAG: substrate-binding periplasmic protein [Thermodesulfobacteriota bacterium]
MKQPAGFPLLAVLICLFSASYGYGTERNHLTINCTLHSPYEAFFFRLVEEVCSRNRISVSRNTPPVERSLMHVNQGIEDGDGPRIAGLASTYPNIVCVPEPFGVFRFGAFTRNQQMIIDGWKGLANWNVAYIRGWKIFDNQVSAAKSITKVNNAEQLFRLLDADRVDLVLITQLAGYGMIQKLDLKGMGFVEPPLAVEPNFLYLHKRHADLAPVMARTLQQIKQDGVYDRLYQEMISPYLRNPSTVNK